MEIPFKTVLLVCVTLVLVVGAGVAGCTYTAVNGNQTYYTAMQNCIAKGGTFVPSSACVMH